MRHPTAVATKGGTRTTAGFPTTAVKDISLSLWKQGYGYLSRQMHQLGTDGFEARLLGRRTVFVSGRAAAKLFYDNSKFTRVGAVPGPLKRTLFGIGTVHGLDGDAHLRRKAMFVSLLDESAADDLAKISARQWEQALREWPDRQSVVLFDEAVQVLARTVCQWAGMSTKGPRFSRFAADLATIVDGFGSVGPRHIKARLARNRCNRWARVRIEAVRDGRLRPKTGTALWVVASHQDESGRLLDSRVAADELLNILRPTVAVAWFVAYAALALHRHPQWRDEAATGKDETLTAFAHEVRRFYPFAPMLGARVREEFEWKSHRFPPGRWVILDIYGTNHDPTLWPQPQRFDPERFINRRPDTYSFLPQGGGDARTGHRCPGESFAIALLKEAVKLLARLDYQLPQQDLSYSLSRIPSRVNSGVIIDSALVATRPPHQ